MLDEFVFVHEFLDTAARRTPDAVALVEPWRSITYGALNELANRFAQLLVARGVARDDRVVLALENSIELVACYFGAMKAGAVAVPLPPGPRSDRFVSAVRDCQPKACVIDPATAQEEAPVAALADVSAVFVHRPKGARRAPTDGGGRQWPELLPALDGCAVEDPQVRVIDLDLAAIIYTSGSTGTPRGVMLTHQNIVANTTSIVEYLGLTAGDRVMCVLPFYYVYGLSLLHTHVAVGGSVVVDNRFVFPNVVLATMRQHRATGFAGVPSTFALLLHRSNLATMEFPDLRYVTQAGGGMPAARILEWLEKGPKVPFFVMYGATEASARLTYLEPENLRRKLGSIGRAIPNVEMLVVKDDGEVAAPGEVGELVARGTNISCGYWNDPIETRKRFGPQGYRTGDLGYADEEGFLYLVGRRHDMIKVGGQRVAAKEIEEVLNEHPGVHEVAVVGVPDDLLGEVPVAFVAVRDGHEADAAALLAFCRERLAWHKVPIRVEFRARLPKAAIGKLDKEALRRELKGEQPATHV